MTGRGVEVANDVLRAWVSSNSLVTNMLAKSVGSTKARDYRRVWLASRDNVLEEVRSFADVGRDVNPNCMDAGSSYTIGVAPGGEESTNNEGLNGRKQR